MISIFGKRRFRYVLAIATISIASPIWVAETIANISDIKSLLPKAVPGHELSWLNGQWTRNEVCSNEKSVYISFSATRDGLFTITRPEPNMTDSIAPVKGWSQVNPGERNFTNVTPPNWEDAYFRVKQNEGAKLEFELVEFDPNGPDWKVTETFTLQKCD